MYKKFLSLFIVLLISFMATPLNASAAIPTNPFQTHIIGTDIQNFRASLAVDINSDGYIDVLAGDRNRKLF